ncbi:MAG: TetR/AcrR family transcriptional regulator [Solirubrobacterales bacterium]|nr:TetR/AcrR family transcriptional regulator [Solirubrobacterales bacterium]
MPPRPQASERARIRGALVDLSFEQGFRNTSLEQILARAEVERAAFEGHYADLEDLFYEFWDEECGRFEARAERARQGLSDWRDRVRATAYALYRYLAEDERLTKVTVGEMRSAGERTLVRFGQAAGALFELIDEGREEPGAPGSLSVNTAQSLGGGVFNQIYMTMAKGDPMPPEDEIVPQLMYAVVLPYLGPEAAQEELSIPPPPLSAA